jgi:diguanylate cyclase (GGDEF)-like protein
LGRALVLAGLVLGAGAQAASPALPELPALQRLAGRDPAAARARIGVLRADAIRDGALARRLALDELDCVILADDRVDAARAVAASGASAAAAAAPSDREARLAGLRLAACGASALLDMGSTREGNDELDRLIALTGADPALQPALGMALMVRGQHRSRRGELIIGQADLLRACTLLRDHGGPGDASLCDWYLANHYKRTGDYADSLDILTRLLAAAQREGRTVDEGVYQYGIAQVHAAREEWDAALHAFDGSLAIARAAGDTSGQAYSEQGVAQSLWHLARGREALQHLDTEDRLLAGQQDPLQSVRATTLRARVLCDLGRADEAVRLLDAKQADLGRSRDDALRAEWLQARARALSLLGRWREAYADLEAADRVQAALTQQRLSTQAASWRMQFNRERDAAELARLRDQAAQAERLHRIQSVALGLGVVLLLVVGGLAANRVVQARRMQDLAMRDELTGLPNRRAALRRLDAALRQARRLRASAHVLMIDVDHFKSINDTHGHGVGDEVLQALARRMADSLRSHDWIGRLGGEEFVAMLASATPAQALSIAERMRAAVAATPCATSVGPLAITISIGLVCCERVPAGPAQALIDAADALLYEAKRTGRNTVRMRTA